MYEDRSIDVQTLLVTGLKLLSIKFLYIWAVVYMLPEDYLLWSYNKNVTLSNIIFELLPFFIGMVVYLRGFYRSNGVSFFSTLFFILFFVPANSGLTLSNDNLDYYILINIFSILLMWRLGHYARKDEVDSCGLVCEEKNEWVFSNNQLTWTIRAVMLAICVFNIVYVYSYNKLNFAMLFSDMYSTRADYAEYAVEIQGTLASYLSLIITKVSGYMLPVYLYYSLANKKFFDAVICLFTLVANYTVEMQKSSLFIIGVVLLILLYEKRKKLYKASEEIISFFGILFLLSIIEYSIRGESFLFGTILNRITYIPTFLTRIYYNFFSENSKLWFTQDAFIIQWLTNIFLKRPYTTSAVGVISEKYFDGLLASPNTGIFAEAYAQMGIVGIGVFPFIDAFIVSKMKKATESYNYGVCLVVMFKLCFSFLNGFSLTTSNLIGVVLFVIITKGINYVNRSNVNN